jgi:hypothetical protein
MAAQAALISGRSIFSALNTDLTTLETSTSSRLTSTVWTLAGGYTVFQGDWGNFDLLAGFRYLGAHANTDYSLAFTIVGPRGNGATFWGDGGISGSRTIWNGIAGLRGRIRVPLEGLFVPIIMTSAAAARI